MNTSVNNFQKAVFGATVIAAALITTLTSVAGADTQEHSIKLLTAKFEPRQVIQIEVGDFHFKPGQIAPVHTHTAPAVGYIVKGTIIYQIEGERPRILWAGDAFFEPTDQRILRFDNASATEEAIFVDVNLEQAGEPFIVFEKQPTEAIDRRSLPTVALDGRTVDQVDIYANVLQRGASLLLDNAEPTLGLVAEGVIELRIDEKPIQRMVAGRSFALPESGSTAVIVNASSEVPAEVITFRLQ